ncbi:MAG: DUF2007 domain-containing protein [Nitrospirota bacterium]|nr:MAG: DUF2007 domain-containing protein [Nitrospirota bacterium]
MKYCDNPDCPYFIRVNKYAEYFDEIDKCSDCGSELKHGERPEVEDIIHDEKEALVNIAGYRDLQDAYLAKGILESEGITVFLKNEHTIGVQWLYSNALGGVQLAVPKEQADDARIILKDIIGETAEDRRAVKVVDDISVCPRCNSTNTKYYDRATKASAFSLLIGLPLMIFGKRYKCLDCNKIWKPY